MSTEEPRNKLVLITGATGGIGRATAIAFAREGGYRLALHYHNAKDAVRDEVAAAITSASQTHDETTEFAFFQADMGNYENVRQLHQQVVTSLGHPLILFNNAGTAEGSHVQNLADVPIETFESTWRVNAGSGILLTQLCLPHMEAQQWGRIIFDSSVAAFTGGVVGPHYASSKSAQHGFIHWLAGSVGKKGVTVNGVAPALIGDTNMMGTMSEEQTAAVTSRVVVGRLGRSEEVAAVVLMMAKNGYLTNKVIAVDGGYYPY